MIPLTISFGTKRAKDQIVRWAIAIVAAEFVNLRNTRCDRHIIRRL